MNESSSDNESHPKNSQRRANLIYLLIIAGLLAALLYQSVFFAYQGMGRASRQHALMMEIYALALASGDNPGTTLVPGYTAQDWTLDSVADFDRWRKCEFSHDEHGSFVV